MKKISSDKLIASSDAASRLGAFDAALKSEHHRHILAKNTQGFTINSPYGIFTINPDMNSIQEFIDLAEKYNLAEKKDESVLNCYTSRKLLEKGGNVFWESGRYPGKFKDPVTLREWLSGANVTPISAAQEKRQEIQEALDRTGTNGS